MAKSQRALNFDHREIAVIFTLFIFVSLLMFTVGILVGKGMGGEHKGDLSHAAIGADTHLPILPGGHEPSSKNHLGTLSDGAPQYEGLKMPSDAAGEISKLEKSKSPTEKEMEPLKLIPKDQPEPDVYAGSLREPTEEPVSASEALLRNPKVAALLSDDPREPASIPVPFSFAEGKFTVQIGSFPNRSDAVQRVDDLKKLGFQHAYFSAKQLGSTKDTWFRVWLGYYPNSRMAEQNAKYLQKRGEVKNYLVRKKNNS